MSWNDKWSFSDRELIEHALDVLPEQDYYVPSSAAYAAARVAGRVAVYIAPGYLWWPGGTWTTNLDPRLIPGGLQPDGSGLSYALSTFMQRDASKPSLAELTEPCPACFLVPSVTGACGCD